MSFYIDVTVIVSRFAWAGLFE